MTLRETLLPTLAASLVSVTFGVASPVRAAAFVTEPGGGPDKWASVWLLRRFVEPAPVLVEETAAPAGENLIPFDAPGAPYDRSGSATTYSALLAGFDIDDAVAERLGERVHEIEIDAWRTEPSLESRVLEQGFRGMQLAFGRESMTQACYVRFFDAAAAAIERDALADTAPAALRPPRDCLEVGEAIGTPLAPGRRVETLSLADTLREVGDGANVVFVDTRERWEYDEGHIPGAINLTVRDIGPDALEPFADADVVIAYCVKDFRGYEAAKALRRLDVPAAIMTPHGMRGWIEAGLPVAGDGRLDGPEAIEALRRVARERPGGSIR